MEFAWDFWTNFKNWAFDSEIESVEIDGPFAAGTRGFTNSKSSGRIEWRIVEARAGRAVIEFPQSGAVGRFAAGCTRITQSEQADVYAKDVAPGLEAGIPAGMKKLCRTMDGCGPVGPGVNICRMTGHSEFDPATGRRSVSGLSMIGSVNTTEFVAGNHVTGSRRGR